MHDGDRASGDREALINESMKGNELTPLSLWVGLGRVQDLLCSPSQDLGARACCQDSTLQGMHHQFPNLAI